MNRIIFTNGTETSNKNKTAGAVVVGTTTADELARVLAAAEAKLQEYIDMGASAGNIKWAEGRVDTVAKMQPGKEYVISYHRTVALAAKGRDAARKTGFLGGLQVVVLDNGFADMRA